jgi:AcrR family transcriptional regulator
MARVDLPIAQPQPEQAGTPRSTRVDAVRNRAIVLEAAAELFEQRGVAAVSMDDVAAAAGVGKGTLYRRFGDRAGLAAALLDEREAELQEALLSGPPPLGPNAAPVERLSAFIDAYVRFVDRNVDLVAMSQTSSAGARLRTGSHRFWVLHCALLLAAAGAPDSGLRAGALLAAVTAEQVRHWTRDEDRPLDELIAALQRLAVAFAT